MKMDEDPDYVSFVERLHPRHESRIVAKRPDGVYLPSYVKNRNTNPSFARKLKRKRIGHDSSTREDPVYLSYVKGLSSSCNAHIVEKRPHGGYLLGYIKNDETNPSFVRKPKRKRIELDWSTKKVPKKSGGERARYEPDSVQSRKRRKEKREGLRGENPVFRGSEGRVYDADYFKLLSRLKVLDNGIALESGGEVIVRYEEDVDTVHELAVHNSSFEEERENIVANDVLVQERMEKDVCLELEAREKTVMEDALIEEKDKYDEIGQLGISSPSLKKSAIQSDNDSVIGQVVGHAEVSVKTGNRIKVKKQKVLENGSQKANQNEKMEIDPGQATHQSEPVPPHLQAFMLLMKKLCPVDKAMYPGFRGNEAVVRPIGEPSSQNLEKKPNQDKKKETSNSSPRSFFDFDWIEEKGEEEELPGKKLEFRHKGNRRGRTEIKGLAGYPDISDTDEEPQIDEIPEKILCRSPSDYRERLIEVLRRPYDRSEYRKLMIEATLRKRKIIYKQLRSGERAMETNEESKSFFDYYPELRSKVERAERGRRLTLLRGFFFWLKVRFGHKYYDWYWQPPRTAVAKILSSHGKKG